MKSIWHSEAEFQAACYKWYMHCMPPEEWGRLIAIYNNPPNGSQLISMGLRPGISDFYYRSPFTIVVKPEFGGAYAKDFPTAWIELKILGKKQNDNQIKFERMVTGWGDLYYVVTEEIEVFKNLIFDLRNGNRIH